MERISVLFSPSLVLLLNVIGLCTHVDEFELFCSISCVTFFEVRSPSTNSCSMFSSQIDDDDDDNDGDDIALGKVVVVSFGITVNLSFSCSSTYAVTLDSDVFVKEETLSLLFPLLSILITSSSSSPVCVVYICSSFSFVMANKKQDKVFRFPSSGFDGVTSKRNVFLLVLL